MTHEFKPDWKLSPQQQMQVALSLSLPKHIPDWPGCTDEQMEAVAADLLKGPSPTPAPVRNGFEEKAKETTDRIVNRILSVMPLASEIPHITDAISTALEEAVREEREACAKVADNALGYGGVPCKQAAALIRSRK